MTKQRAQRALINIEYKAVKPIVEPLGYAISLGSGFAAFAVVFQGPALNWGLLAGGSSLVLHWVRGNLTRPKKSKPAKGGAVGAGSLIVNGKKIPRVFEYAPYQPGHVSRETFGGTLRRWATGRPEPRRGIDQIHVPREFVFWSQYDGQPVEIREDDLRRFLRAAWKYRHRGVGLGQRHWVREWRQRPQWYKDLGPHWYKAVLALIGQAQQITQRQLIVCIGPQWYSLARDPHTTFARLKEAEAAMKWNSQPDAVPVATDDDLIIGTEGVSSF